MPKAVCMSNIKLISDINTKLDFVFYLKDSYEFQKSMLQFSFKWRTKDIYTLIKSKL